MKSIKGIKFAILMAVAAFSSGVLNAQGLDLPVIPDDPSVKISFLPCGIRLYYVPNSSVKNLVSMALVQIPDSTMQKSQFAPFAEKSMQAAAFHEKPLDVFLSSNGMLPRRKGYFSTDKNIIYHIDSLYLSRGETVLDSTLFSLFRIAGHGALNGIPPASQALIVAGDVNYENLKKKAQMLSIACPGTEGENHAAKYQWYEPKTWGLGLEEGRVSRITAQWRDSRIPQQYIKTVLPAMSAKMSTEFGVALSGRLYAAFMEQGVHVWMNYEFKGSASFQGDELSTLMVYCAKTQTESVMKIILTELDRLYTYGMTQEEYCRLRDANRHATLVSENPAIKSNEKEVERCIAHFICGASLATGLSTMKFEYRQMPDSTQARLFNNYIHKRLSIGCHVDSSLAKRTVSVTRDSIRRALAKYVPSSGVKAPKDLEEYVTGGRKWNFPQGPIAIHKKLAAGVLVQYCYAVKGGSQWADIDYLNCIDGVSSNTLSLFLRSIGAKMDVKVTPACVYLFGSVPSENFDTMVNVLCAISLQKENQEVFSADRYKLFITSGPINYEDVKKTLAKYAPGFGSGTKIAVGLDSEDVADFDEQWDNSPITPSRATFTEFPLDLCSKNYALSRIARFILRDKVAVALCQDGTTARIRCGFKDYPEEKYRVTIIPSKDGYKEDISSVIESLASVPIRPEQLKKYIAVARDEFTTYKTTPQYYIDAATQRYIDFKDLFSDFDVQVQKISAADLNSFFNAALENIK